MAVSLEIAYAAGALHVLSRSLLLFRLLVRSNVAGLSLITQEVFLVVYIMRYLDLLALYVNLGDTLVKVGHLGVALAIVLLIRYSPSISSTYEADLDSVPRALILVPPFLLALISCFLTNYIMIVEIFHQFSWYLEPLALIPQFAMLAKRPTYPPWVLGFVGLAGTEAMVTAWPLLSNIQGALKTNPYGLYAAWVSCGVLVIGGAALVAQAVRVRQSAKLNESGQKPAFSEEWDGSRFAFATEQAEPGQTAKPAATSITISAAQANAGRL